jgi:hypothetical protein
VRNSKELVRGSKEATGETVVHRGRVLLQPEQRQNSDSETVEVPVQLLVAFTRRLLHETVSGDAIYLAAMSAKRDVEATDEEWERLTGILMAEHKRGRIWPKGF